MEFKGTKGIYYTSYIRGIGNRVMSNDNGKVKTICTLNQNNHEDAYNGKLLSKALGMLEMLKILIQDIEYDGNYSRQTGYDLEEAKRLINEATNV